MKSLRLVVKKGPSAGERMRKKIKEAPQMAARVKSLTILTVLII